MATQPQTVAEAESNLKVARDAALRARVGESRKELKQVRAQGKRLRAELAVLSAKIREADSAITAGRNELYKIDAAIAARCAPLPDVLAEPEDFTEEITSLRAYRQEVLEKMQAAQLRGGSRDDVLKIGLELERLQFVAANLINIIEHGGKMGGLEGGLSRVG